MKHKEKHHQIRTATNAGAGSVTAIIAIPTPIDGGIICIPTDTTSAENNHEHVKQYSYPNQNGLKLTIVNDQRGSENERDQNEDDLISDANKITIRSYKIYDFRFFY